MSRLKWIPIVSGSIMLFFFATVFFGLAVIQGVVYLLDFFPDNPDIYKGKPYNHKYPESSIICTKHGETNPSNCTINGPVVTVGP